jgi:predicted RNase H-like HicB family nuclease
MAKNKSHILSYKTIIQKDGKYYHGFVPALPGCHTQGKTIEETRENLREAMIGWLESTTEHG